MHDTVVFAAPRAPWPLDAGVAIRVHRLATGLARAFDVVFVTFEHDPASGSLHQPLEEVERALGGLEVVMVPGLRRLDRRPGRLAEAASLPRRHSLTWARYRLPAFAQTVRRVAARHGARLVHFDDPVVALGGPVSGAINVLSAHNVEHRLVAAESVGASLRRRAVNAREWRRVRRDERAVWRSMDLCLAVSELDAEAMRAGGAGRVGVCPVGTDPVELLPPPRREPGEPVRLLFVGVGDYPPNERGLAWLIREVVPRVRETMPVSLHVVGRLPRRPVQAPGVEYLGSVPRVDPHYERAHVAVVPIFEGSGTRQKIVEAMAFGRPVVSTTVGAEGLPLEPATHYDRADDPDAFAAAIVRVARRCEEPDPLLGARLARARQAVSYSFWPNVIDGLIDRYHEALAEPTPLAIPHPAAAALAR